MPQASGYLEYPGIIKILTATHGNEFLNRFKYIIRYSAVFDISKRYIKPPQNLPSKQTTLGIPGTQPSSTAHHPWDPKEYIVIARTIQRVTGHCAAPPHAMGCIPFFFRVSQISTNSSHVSDASSYTC